MKDRAQAHILIGAANNDAARVTLRDTYRRAKPHEELDAKICIDGRNYILVRREIVSSDGSTSVELPL